ncbi:MAG: hypothetical protein ABI763_06415 [Bacteroidota bacterium]
MKKKLLILLAFSAFAIQSKAQLSDEEYAYVTMDLQGILNLTMTTDPTVNFTFKTIPEYQNGLIKFNATKLDVDATVAWDLFAYASTDNWTQVDAYSTNGQATLPAEILEMQSINSNTTAATDNFNALVSLKGLTNSGVVGGVPAATTQFLAGMVGTAAGESYGPGAANSNPSTNQFRVHYRLKPGIPATFPNSTVALAAPGFAQSGYYYLEVVYSLVEDL